jgi:solute carrier family 30 (zinc transporter), member 5/7
MRSVDGSYLLESPLSPEDREGVFSPVTPSYRFGVDEDFAMHASSHTPNLHDHSHVHVHDRHTHHGHSDNMRGVFLHVMAVRLYFT